jgi:glycosyltransferase involved in cell wall biosynthesis
LLSPPEDVDGFATRLERLLVDPVLRERLATRAREHVVARFDRRANLPHVLGALASAALVPRHVAPRAEEWAAQLQAAAA